MLRFDRKQQNSVKQLSFNKNKLIKKTLDTTLISYNYLSKTVLETVNSGYVGRESFIFLIYSYILLELFLPYEFLAFIKKNRGLYVFLQIYLHMCLTVATWNRIITAAAHYLMN